MKILSSLTALGLVMLPLTAEAQTIIQDTFFGDNTAVVQHNVYPQRRVVQQTRKVYKTYKTEKVVNNTTNNYNTTVVSQATPPAPAPAPVTPSTPAPAPAPVAPVVQTPNVVVNVNPYPAPVARTCVQQVVTLDPYSGYPLAQPYVIRSPGCY